MPEIKIPVKNLEMPACLIVPSPDSDQPTKNQPEGATLPGLVVVHDSYGLDHATRRACERLAGLGYVTLAPDLFAREGGPKDTSSDKALLDFTLGLPDSRLVNDTITALNVLLERRPDVDAARLGVVGWGWGGAVALLAAAHDSRFHAAANIGGHLTYPATTAHKPGSPLSFVGDINGALFSAYAENDAMATPDEIARLKARLLDNDRRGEVKVYTGTGPRFWRDEALPQTALLWRRLQTFLADNIGNPDAWGEGYPHEASRLHA